jgi:hypothetical protein
MVFPSTPRTLEPDHCLGVTTFDELWSKGRTFGRGFSSSIFGKWFLYGKPTEPGVKVISAEPSVAIISIVVLVVFRKETGGTKILNPSLYFTKRRVLQCG